MEHGLSNDGAMRSVAVVRLVAVSVMLPVQVQTQAGTAHDRELVSNGRFSKWSEAAPTNWVVGKSVRVEKETGDTASAPFAVRLTGAGPISALEAHWLLQRRVFTPGQPYVISVSAKRVSGSGHLSIGMGYHKIGQVRSHSEWAHVRFEAMGDKKYGGLTFGADKGAVWLMDDVSVRALRLSEPGPAERPAASGAAAGNGARKKKLIKAAGYDYPDLVRREIRNMERLPFDGINLKLHDWRNSISVFRPQPYDETKLAQDFEDLRHIKWNRFTDNFVRAITAKKEHPRQDWFDDTHWEAIQHNARLVAKAARIGRCVGVCFDPEAYGPNPWAYQEAAHKISKTFAQYEAMVRKRGAQFVRAIESEFPNAKILTYIMLSQVRAVAPRRTRGEVKASLSWNSYALLPAFLDGMLDGASTGTVIVDGNEPSYYYTDREQFLDAYHYVAQRALRFVDPANWNKYRTQVQVGQAVFLDELMQLRKGRRLANYLTPAQQRLWLEHNTYWALYCSDEYVWLHDGNADWWKGKGLPKGAVEAVRSARRKIHRHEPLGFDLRPIMAKAMTAFNRDMNKGAELRSATVVGLPADTESPRIDGRLDDPAWERVTPLEEFVKPGRATCELEARTKAWVSYNRQCLFIAVECQEPAPEKMKILGQGRDHLNLWRGDDVEVLIGGSDHPLPYRHFMVNPGGGYWESFKRHEGGLEDMTYNPQWQRAAHIGADSWATEMAIPWKALGMDVPASGTSIRANICRSRTQKNELSMWSRTRESFVEHTRFGVWRFR